MATSIKAQQWIDTNLYPFQHHYIQLQSGKMHYVDEGEGDIILMIHGTPTWSFLYRDFIKELAKNHRCIAIDHLGFGLSEHPEDFAGTPEAHAQNLSEFITTLDLDNITLVVHDFGGPIGLAAGIQHANRIKQIVLMNSWLWETKNKPTVVKAASLLNSKLGRFLYLDLNFSINVLLKKAFYNKKKLSKTIKNHYKKPFPTKKSRRSLLQIAQSLINSSDWYATQWQQLAALENKPWHIIWGKYDPYFSMEDLDTWTNRLPHAQVQVLDCGHFVQEEKPEEVIEHIKTFMAIPTKD